MRILLPSCSCVSTNVWMHYLDFNEKLGEKIRSELDKDAACCFEQILLYGLLLPISQTVLIRRAKYEKYYQRNKDELK